VLGFGLSDPSKLWRTYLDAARLLRKAGLAERRADTLAKAALKMQADGDPNRAEVIGSRALPRIYMPSLVGAGPHVDRAYSAPSISRISA
jgi:hypothetical protein